MNECRSPLGYSSKLVKNTNDRNVNECSSSLGYSLSFFVSNVRFALIICSEEAYWMIYTIRCLYFKTLISDQYGQPMCTSFNDWPIPDGLRRFHYTQSTQRSFYLSWLSWLLITWHDYLTGWDHYSSLWYWTEWMTIQNNISCSLPVCKKIARITAWFSEQRLFHNFVKIISKNIFEWCDILYMTVIPITDLVTSGRTH